MPTKDVLLIYNPVAGAKNRLDIPKIIKDEIAKRNLTFDWFETRNQKHQPLDEAFQTTYDRVLVVGGDGTVNEVAGFIVEHKLKSKLGIVAQGTANLLAQSLGIPVFDTKKAIRFALDHEAKPVDAMHINKKYYGFVAAGQGYDTKIMKETNRQMKRTFGFFAYVFTFLRTFFSYRKQYYHLTIDGERHVVVGKFVMIMNALSFAGIHVEDDVRPNDGMLNVVIANPRSLIDFVSIGLRRLFRRTLKTHPRFQFFTGKQIDVKQKRAKHVQIDGELIKAKRLHVDVVEKALHVVH